MTFLFSWIEKLGILLTKSERFDFIGGIEGLGRFFQHGINCFVWSFRKPFRLKLLSEQCFFIGNKSLFIIFLTSSFSGMVFAYQTYIGFTAFSVDSFIGPIVAISVLKELAPVFTGLVVAGRCGAAMAAQIGTMKVTEQIDALEVMGINAVQYLAVPRVIASVIAVPILTAIFMLIANIGSWVIGVKVLQIDDVTYMSRIHDFVHWGMISEGLIKGGVFGLLISLIGTYQGFNVVGGAEGVGKGTNMAVVWGMILVLIVDFFLTALLAQIL